MVKTLTSAEKAEAVREYERHTNGSENWHKNFLGFIYTDGIKFLADTCGAHWLIEIAASYQGRLKDEDFQLWVLHAPKKEGGPWAIEAWTDTPHCEGSKRLIRQEISYSDFPVELCTPKSFQFYVENKVALLKGER